MKAKLLSVIFMIGFSAQAFGSLGPGSSGGGDICEDNFNLVKSDITSWIFKGGSKGLNLPNSISLREYDAKMLFQLKGAHVSCTNKRLQVGTNEKTCVRFFDRRSIPQILCNRDAFAKTNLDDQYVLVHHEYAGLAGIELNDGDRSNYTISNQITGYLETKTVKRLALVKPVAQPNNDVRANFQEFAGYYRVVSCEHHLETTKQETDNTCEFKNAELFLGEDYQPKPGKNNFYLNLTNQAGKLGVGINLAFEVNEAGDVCSTYTGIQFCNSPSGGFVFNTSIKKKNNQIILDHIFSWPDRSKYLYQDYSLILERID